MMAETSMSCADAHEALLVADPAELDAGWSGPLAAHLRGCATCRQQAAAIVHGTAALRAAIDEVVAERGVAPGGSIGDVAVKRGVAKQIAAERVVAPGASHATRRIARRRLPPRILLPLALAAALAAVIAVDRGLIPVSREPALADVYHPEPVVPTSPVVNAVGGSGVAVMTTPNPRITIVWSF